MVSLSSCVRAALRSLYPGLRMLQFTPRRIFGLLPVLTVCLLIALGYIAIVVVTLVPMLAAKPFWATVLLLLVHCILVLLLWSYAAVVLVDPGHVPATWSFARLGWPLELRGSPEARDFVAKSDLSDAADGSERGMLVEGLRFVPNDKVKLPAVVLMRNRFNRYRYCSKCLIYKPDRAHHCSALERCVLKMDHFCPWTNNTVGFYNHKFFVQFLYYGFMACLVTAVLSFPAIVQRLSMEISDEQTGEFVIVILGLIGWIVCVIFAFALLFFAAFHTYLVLRNRTTIETYEATDPTTALVLEAFDLGPRANWKSVFGEHVWAWILPVWSRHHRGDGISWETRVHREAFV
jgi:hypothetical protein